MARKFDLLEIEKREAERESKFLEYRDAAEFYIGESGNGHSMETAMWLTQKADVYVRLAELYRS